MDREQVIRKAVELADGCSIHGMTVKVGAYEFGWCADDVLNQVWLDALAAQLVRQVDALPDVYFYTGESEGKFYAEFAIEGEDPKWRFLRAGHLVKGPDRTMNTLRAIVESEVLFS